MESSKPSTRKAAFAGAFAVAFALGAGAYFASVKPAESEVLPVAKTQAPAGAPAAAAAASATAATADAAASAPAAHKQRTREQAAAALMALPELQAWSAMLEKSSGGKTHGALIEYDPAPRKLNGKSYWQFSFVENSAEAALRWESFLASSSDDEILVEDVATDQLLSLERWRKEKNPSRRSGVDG